MAAPCTMRAGRPLLQLLNSFARTGGCNAKVRSFAVSCVCRATLNAQRKTESLGSPWKLMGAVCLRRLPVITQDRTPIEECFGEMLHMMESEKSLLSDHELKLLEDAERMRRRQANEYDSDDEEDDGDREIVLTQDLEDAWEQRLKAFQLAPRVRDDVHKDLTRMERCLADSLFLLVEQKVGNETVWLLPQSQWQPGESLRQTAERALASIPVDGVTVTLLGNAPCGVYKYKLPRAVQTESCVGVKVFFFKAVLSGNSPAPIPTAPFLWLRKSELQDYLKPEYLKKVNTFILDV
ncbi:39S ribosomal protein L46, mitochondrial [Lampris incognitus]|uniref:39S ribosomal protein L46, mitochondrial n=1 Tax=Lampris incognitus TaxID=2546036 RepID=UPI0024B55C54|nr:39S ribosomal protein L46, mitochondrial [Lampris incognitus]